MTRWIAGTAMLAAGLTLACSGGRAEQRGPGATAQSDTTQKTGATAGSAAANEQAASTRPSEGAGGLDPHPLVTGSQQGNPQYGADQQAQAGRPVEQPGSNEGRNARVDRAPAGAQGQGGAQASAGAAAAQPPQPPAQELPEVAGRLTAVSPSELTIQQPGRGDVRLRIDPSTTSIDLDGRQATLHDLVPGTEVRASYEEAKGAKQATAIHAKTGSAATTTAPAQ